MICPSMGVEGASRHSNGGASLRVRGFSETCIVMVQLVVELVRNETMIQGVPIRRMLPMAGNNGANR